jgi:hypothetical protein
LDDEDAAMRKWWFAPAVFLFLSGDLNAQTPDIQDEVAATIELKRIGQGQVFGLVTGHSGGVLLRPRLNETLDSLRRLILSPPTTGHNERVVP